MLGFTPTLGQNGVATKGVGKAGNYFKTMSTIPKPALVKLASEQLLKVLSLIAWGVGSVVRDATSRMEKDEDLEEMIRSTGYVYARQWKKAWDVKNWDREPNKTN